MWSWFAYNTAQCTYNFLLEFYPLKLSSCIISLDVAYADANNLWEANSGNSTDFANKAKVPVTNGYVGITRKGELTRTKTGYIHGCPGNP